MISNFKQILSEKLRASGIRGCMAAGAVTAGIAALAVIGGINGDDISTVSLETDAIPEETSVSTEAKAEKSVKRTYSHDMEYLSKEDIAKIEAEMQRADETETAVETEMFIETEAAEEYVPAADEATEAPEEAAEAPEESFEEEAETEAETSDEELFESEPDEQEADETNEADSTAPETEEEGTEDVAVYTSAADGDDDGNGLSSALDLDVNDEAAEIEEPVAELSAEMPAPIALMAAPDNTDEDDDESGIPEDITLDDENEDADTAPDENAVSLLDVPQWLSFDENGVPTEYVTVLTGNACAYTAEPDALMSTGEPVFQGYVAVDPDIIPYGSELYIVAEDGEVYGYAIAADTGYSVREGHIIVDLFMNEYDDCIQWGNKPVNVYVLK